MHTFLRNDAPPDHGPRLLEGEFTVAQGGDLGYISRKI
jgi:hypothetical protein